MKKITFFLFAVSVVSGIVLLCSFNKKPGTGKEQSFTSVEYYYVSGTHSRG